MISFLRDKTLVSYPPPISTLISKLLIFAVSCAKRETEEKKERIIMCLIRMSRVRHC